MRMSGAALFIGPMARKKKVISNIPSNSYRVISTDAEDIPGVRRSSNSQNLKHTNWIGQPSQVRPESEHRHNRPNPRNVNFLRQNVSTLNEPVCNVATSSTVDEQQRWWPHVISNKPHKQPGRPLDSTVREDFQYRGMNTKPSGRFTSRTNNSAANGVVPVNFLREDDNKQRFWRESISYEHQYNCRLDPQYPIRAKRHGGFVWNRMDSDKVNTMLQQQNLISDKSCQTSESKPTSAPKKLNTENHGQGSACTENNQVGSQPMPVVAL